MAGTEAQARMGLPVIGFAGGRPDVWEPDDDIYWGAEKEYGSDAHRLIHEEGKAPRLEGNLGATEMGLIYVNPEGNQKDNDPIVAAYQIRDTFGRMGMNDEETVALIAGGHTFGKGHGAGPDQTAGPAPEEAPMEQAGIGWKQSYGEGKGKDAVGSGMEVTWTYHPTRWDNEFFHILFGYEWELTDGGHGHKWWKPKDNGGSDMVPEADLSGHREPRMMTTDLSLREDPIYREISLRFKDDQKAFTEAYAKAWFKLTHRDMGPKSRYLGKDVPEEDFIWQDPIPKRDYALIEAEDVKRLEQMLEESGLSQDQMLNIAWSAASSFRYSDKRGGANGGRIRLEPQVNFEANRPAELKEVIPVLEKIVDAFNQSSGEKKVSFADVVVLAGNVAIKQGLKKAGYAMDVPFTPGRTDATEEMTDVENDRYLEPVADGFRNYMNDRRGNAKRAEYWLVDRANQLHLTVPEMTVLLGGLRALGYNYDHSDRGVLTERVGALTTDFFRNVLSMQYEWHAADEDSTWFEATDLKTGEKKWSATRADLVFSSNSELRAVAEVYASDDAEEKFARDFVNAWAKVMDLDRFDLR